MLSERRPDPAPAPGRCCSMCASPTVAHGSPETAVLVGWRSHGRCGLGDVCDDAAEGGERARCGDWREWRG